MQNSSSFRAHKHSHQQPEIIANNKKKKTDGKKLPTARNYNPLCAPEILKNIFLFLPHPRQHLSFCILFIRSHGAAQKHSFSSQGKIPVPFCRHAKDSQKKKTGPTRMWRNMLVTKQNTISANFCFASQLPRKGCCAADRRTAFANSSSSGKQQKKSFLLLIIIIIIIIVMSHFLLLHTFSCQRCTTNRIRREEEKRKEGSQFFFFLMKSFLKFAWKWDVVAGTVRTVAGWMLLPLFRMRKQQLCCNFILLFQYRPQRSQRTRISGKEMLC